MGAETYDQAIGELAAMVDDAIADCGYEVSEDDVWHDITLSYAIMLIGENKHELVNELLRCQLGWDQEEVDEWRNRTFGQS